MLVRLLPIHAKVAHFSLDKMSVSQCDGDHFDNAFGFVWHPVLRDHSLG